MSYQPQPPVFRPPQKTDASKIIIIVVVVFVVMVLLTVVASAVLYIMVSGLLGGGSMTSHPSVILSLQQSGADPNSTANLTVSHASYSDYFINYRIEILMDGINTGSRTPSPGNIITFGGAAKVIVMDNGEQGILDEGDVFHVYGLGGTHAWRLNMMWASDGYYLTGMSWNTP